MKGMNDFLRKLTEETDDAGKEDSSKNLAKEEALRLIADFVKTVKGKFPKSADRIEVLNACENTLRFYIDELEGEQFAGSLSIDLSGTEDIPEDNFSLEDEEDEEEDD